MLCTAQIVLSQVVYVFATLRYCAKTAKRIVENFQREFGDVEAFFVNECLYWDVRKKKFSNGKNIIIKIRVG